MEQSVKTNEWEWDYYYTGEWEPWGYDCDEEWAYCSNLECGEWVYYAHLEKQQEIYKMRMDGSDKQKWAEPLPIHVEETNDYFRYALDCDLFFCGGWIYFISKYDDDRRAEFYKMRPDGSGCVKLYSVHTGSAYHVKYNISQIKEGWIYYSTDDYGRVNECKIRTDGSENQYI